MLEASSRLPVFAISSTLPNNPDGTPHDCPNKKSGGKQSTFPAADPAKVLEECQAFHNTFGDLDAARFESLAKIYISRMMRK